MKKKLVIDLIKLRNYDDIPVEGIFREKGYDKSFKTIRELATFHFTCRKCTNAPCINACPVKALSKDEDSVINRANYKCIRCKSCIVICPFGTLVDDLFAVKAPGRRFIALDDENAMEEFASCFPDEVVVYNNVMEDSEKEIFTLGDDILVIEKSWKQDG